ncbi:transposable element Tcb2 transposase [Trichonephila clavipes]|nr:transposable element Tcb2 transposase [Trichonephila clavipes]
MCLVSGTIPPHTVLRHTARTAGVMVWGTIAYDSWPTLIVMRGALTGQRYVDDILRPHDGPFLNSLPGAIVQQNNARPHTARVSQDFLRPFQTLPWPAHSPDLSPLEHILHGSYKNCDRYKNDPDSVHELANLIIEERKYDETQQLELEKIREKSKLDLEIARIRANDKDNNTEVNCNDSSSVDSLIKSIRTLTVKIPDKPEG